MSLRLRGFVAVLVLLALALALIGVCIDLVGALRAAPRRLLGRSRRAATATTWRGRGRAAGAGS